MSEADLRGLNVEHFTAQDSHNQSVVIEAAPVLSSVDIVRRASDPRILLDQSDLRLAHRVTAEDDDSNIAISRRGLSFSSIIDEDSARQVPSQTFVLNDGTGLTEIRAAQLLEEYGPNVLPEKHKPAWLLFAEQLWQPMPIAIWIACIILAAIQSWPDVGILLALNFGNASISYYESSKAGDAVAALKAQLQFTAVAKRGGQWIRISAADVVPGDLIQLNAGTTCPADCRVHGDEVEVDQSALTGESLPVIIYRRDQCKMGSTIVHGETEATVEFTGSRTYFGKTATLLTTDSKLSNLQKCLIRVVSILSILSFVMCITAFIYLLVKPEAVPVEQALSFAVVLLVASIPLAMEIVVTTSLALGSRSLSAEGAICAR